ncbi:MAG: hypothetical protein ACJAVA_001744 [Flavobacteriaceae bacterium]|jgi:hypothetical protein
MKRVKYIFGLIGISFIILSFSNCGSSKSMDSEYKLVEVPPFVISKIFSQKWAAGAQEGGSGTNIQITFENLNEEVEIKNIYFRDQITKANGSKNEYTGAINNKLRDGIIMDSDPVKEANNTPPIKFPFQLSYNDVVISYMNNGNLAYFKIENIEEKPMLAYPQGNPNSKN